MGFQSRIQKSQLFNHTEKIKSSRGELLYLNAPFYNVIGLDLNGEIYNARTSTYDKAASTTIKKTSRMLASIKHTVFNKLSFGTSNGATLQTPTIWKKEDCFPSVSI